LVIFNNEETFFCSFLKIEKQKISKLILQKRLSRNRLRFCVPIYQYSVCNKRAKNKQKNNSCFFKLTLIIHLFFELKQVTVYLNTLLLLSVFKLKRNLKEQSTIQYNLHMNYQTMRLTIMHYSHFTPISPPNLFAEVHY
jgi:hypothetical protein